MKDDDMSRKGVNTDITVIIRYKTSLVRRDYKRPHTAPTPNNWEQGRPMLTLTEKKVFKTPAICLFIKGSYPDLSHLKNTPLLLNV